MRLLCVFRHLVCGSVGNELSLFAVTCSEPLLSCRPELKGTGLGVGKSSGFMYADYEAPKEMDWRKKGAVSEVKNQQQVCYAQYL